MNVLPVSSMPPPRITLDRQALADDIRSLPSLPNVVVQLQALMMQNDASIDCFANTLQLDQALSVKVLQLANSPFYGLSNRIGSVRDAINVLGLRQLGTLVLAAALTVQFEKLHGKALHIDAFWRHSIACAVAARQIARLHGMNEAAAFTAGLLHDVGRLVVDSHYPEEAAVIMEWADSQDLPYFEAEQALTGVHHAELGQWVCQHWHFAPEITEAIAGHHQPGSEPKAMLADVVQVADALAHALDLAELASEAVPAIHRSVWQRLALTEQRTGVLLRGIEEEFQQLESVLRPRKETP